MMNKEQIFNILYDKENWDVWHKFQEIEKSIEEIEYLYQYFEDFQNMLLDKNSAVKMRGFRIICKLSKWDKKNKIENVIDNLLKVLDDDKPTIVRQCLSVIDYLLLYKPELSEKIKYQLEQTDYSKYKDSMKPLIKKDIDSILKKL